MPAKPCPACGLVNPASATHCDCGHSFTGGELVVASQRVCPACRWVNRRTSIECQCGHSFYEVTEEERDHLTHQLTTAWFAIVGGAVMVCGGVGLAILQAIAGMSKIMVPTGLVLAGLGVAAKGMRDVGRARIQLDALPARPLGPPRARLLKK